MPASFFARYRSIDNRPLLGGIMQSESSRYQRKEEAELRLELVKESNGAHCDGEVVPCNEYPEIFVHCGPHSQAIGGKCFGCGKTLTIADAKATMRRKK